MKTRSISWLATQVINGKCEVSSASVLCRYLCLLYNRVIYVKYNANNVLIFFCLMSQKQGSQRAQRTPHVLQVAPTRKIEEVEFFSKVLDFVRFCQGIVHNFSPPIHRGSPRSFSYALGLYTYATVPGLKASRVLGLIGESIAPLLGVGCILAGSIPFFVAILLAQVTSGAGYTFLSGAAQPWSLLEHFCPRCCQFLCEQYGDAGKLSHCSDFAMEPSPG